MTRVITFKVDEDLLYELDIRARQLNMSRSRLIKTIIKEYLNTNPVKKRYRVKFLELK